MTWFLESIRVFDVVITALEEIGIVTDLISVRNRNRSFWDKATVRLQS
ncbi:hypothetical protein DFR72_10314 [Lentzea flaviverrucosa]|uniref:Uncharacterized protein n=1 Tax=Lentzea flaviverrucosa TaxID=200379 RepID=A0A1H9C049_9PSEU|nr:hypothetical protein DFR72_10314 [Lentzea flaviverrucosa]SEP94381.1 hypothetical protein SAMN05216195_101643 [Lentzea flaviverrucosa]